MLGCNGNGRNSQVFGQAMKKRPTGHTRNLWPPHFCTFCELVEGEENKLTTFSTWTIMLGCNGSGRNSQVFGQAMKKRPTGHTRNLWPPHFRTFCELVEGEENKLTTFSTWTIMLGCNGSGRNSQVFGQAMKKRPTGHTRNLWPPHFRTFCELVEGEENKLTTFSTLTIMLGCNGNGRNSQVFGQEMKKRPTGHTRNSPPSLPPSLPLSLSPSLPPSLPLQVPAVIVYGEKDDALGKWSLARLEKLPNHAVSMVPGAGHAAYMDQPKLWHNILYNFLNSL